MIKEKNIVTAILLTIVTCGIYGIIWFINITDDMAVASDDKRMSGGMAFLLTLVTCGIYGYYWAYQMGKLQAKAQQRYSLPEKDNSVLYLILQVCGLGLVNWCLIQSELNQIATKTA